jgi:hypothetical protein
MTMAKRKTEGEDMSHAELMRMIKEQDRLEAAAARRERAQLGKILAEPKFWLSEDEMRRLRDLIHLGYGRMKLSAR